MSYECSFERRWIGKGFKVTLRDGQRCIQVHIASDDSAATMFHMIEEAELKLYLAAQQDKRSEGKAR